MFFKYRFFFVCFNCTQLRSCITYYSLRLPIGNHIVCIAHYKLCVRNILLFFFKFPNRNDRLMFFFSFCLLMEYSTPNMYAKKTMLHAQLCINWFKARIPNYIVSLDFFFENISMVHFNAKPKQLHNTRTIIEMMACLNAHFNQRKLKILHLTKRIFDKLLHSTSGSLFFFS